MSSRQTTADKKKNEIYIVKTPTNLLNSRNKFKKLNFVKMMYNTKNCNVVCNNDISYLSVLYGTITQQIGMYSYLF